MFRRLVGNSLRRILRPLGYSIVPLALVERDENPLVKAVREYRIDLVLDVGANVGQTGMALRAAGYQGRIVSFEPQRAAFQQLQRVAHGDADWECRQLALGESSRVVEMQISGFTPSSSILHMNKAHVELWPSSGVVGVEVVQVRTLDEMAEELRLSGHRILLKLDTQGYEAQVLRGASRSLRSVSAVYAELLFISLYDGQAEYHEVMNLLDAAVLRFAGLFEGHHDAVTKLPIFADGLFVRPT
jgi:FkbM family methyltransferase